MDVPLLVSNAKSTLSDGNVSVQPSQPSLLSSLSSLIQHLYTKLLTINTDHRAIPIPSLKCKERQKIETKEKSNLNRLIDP